MSHSRCRIAALVAGLLFLQALVVAHAFDHPATEHADHQCIACLHGHGGGHALPAAEPATIPPTVTAHAGAEDIRTPATSRIHAYRSRAPPLSSLL